VSDGSEELADALEEAKALKFRTQRGTRRSPGQILAHVWCYERDLGQVVA
jgi:hypothetical protein